LAVVAERAERFDPFGTLERLDSSHGLSASTSRFAFSWRIARRTSGGRPRISASIIVELLDACQRLGRDRLVADEADQYL
jgi:hypothetical protein